MASDDEADDASSARELEEILTIHGLTKETACIERSHDPWEGREWCALREATWPRKVKAVYVRCTAKEHNKHVSKLCFLTWWRYSDDVQVHVNSVEPGPENSKFLDDLFAEFEIQRVFGGANKDVHPLLVRADLLRVGEGRRELRCTFCHDGRAPPLSRVYRRVPFVDPPVDGLHYWKLE